MNAKTNMMVKAAVAGLLGVAAAGSVMAGDKAMDKGEKKAAKKQTAEVAKCWGVNKCSGKGKCGGKGHGCAGHNTCKGKGWLLMPAESCTSIEGGVLADPEMAAPAPADKK